MKYPKFVNGNCDERQEVRPVLLSQFVAEL